MELPLQEFRIGWASWQLRDENTMGRLSQLTPQLPPSPLPAERELISLIQNGKIQKQANKQACSQQRQETLLFIYSRMDLYLLLCVPGTDVC